MKSASQQQINAAYAMGAGYGQVIRPVILPSALPDILVGMRTDIVITGIIVSGVVAYLFDRFMRWVEVRLVAWKGRR